MVMVSSVWTWWSVSVRVSPSAAAFCSELLAPSSSRLATPRRAQSRTLARAADKTGGSSRHAPTDNAIFRELRCPTAAPPELAGPDSDNHAVLSGRVNVRLAGRPPTLDP